MPISEAVQRWWPLPASMDLVYAPVQDSATAVLAEVTRFAAPGRLRHVWVPFSSLDETFGSVEVFTNVPTIYFVLPTRSNWSVLWNNSFLCDGYDSLCYCLTTRHGLTTLHWRSADEDAVFQAGSLFTYRTKGHEGLRERSVYCCKCDDRWEFDSTGPPMRDENVAAYSARKIRDRLNEKEMLELLARLGARPWDDAFYSPTKAFRIERLEYADSISQKSFTEFACERGPVRG